MPVLFPSLFPADGIYLKTGVSRQSVEERNVCLDKCSCSEMKGKCLHVRRGEVPLLLGDPDRVDKLRRRRRPKGLA